MVYFPMVNLTLPRQKWPLTMSSEEFTLWNFHCHETLSCRVMRSMWWGYAYQAVCCLWPSPKERFFFVRRTYSSVDGIQACQLTVTISMSIFFPCIASLYHSRRKAFELVGEGQTPMGTDANFWGRNLSYPKISFLFRFWQFSFHENAEDIS